MSLSDKLYRFKSSVFQYWGERQERESEVLSQLRDAPGFQALLDVFDAEIRTLFLKWSMSQTSAVEAEALRQRAIATLDMVAMLEGATSAKGRQDQAKEEAERQVALMHTDQRRKRELMASQQRARAG